jgi:hypothetical protein
LSIKLIQSYPFWFVMLCIFAGLIYAGILYFRNQRHDFSRPWLILLSFFRFMVVSTIAFLLLSPLLQTTTSKTEKPILIFAQDNSNSLTLIADSAYYKNTYLEDVEEFLEILSTKFDTRNFVFGEAFRESDKADFVDKATDISQVFDGIDDIFSNRNIGAVVLASDGIFNRGVNPVFASANLGYPVFTLALGDTTKHRDLILKRISNNRITYLGNKFPVEIEIEAQALEGSNTRLSISREGQVIYSQNISVPSNSHFETLKVELEADKPGTHRYSAFLNKVGGEISEANNRAEFFIEVIDGRQQVLIVAAAPHPDVAALKMAIENNDNFELTSVLINELRDSPEKYNLVILHQIPSKNNPASSLIQRLKQTKVPYLIVVGAQTNLGLFNALQTGLSINPRTNDYSETLPVLNSEFLLFGIDQRTNLVVPNLPPLRSPFAEYKLGAGTQSVFYQKIGTVATQQPLITFSQIDGQKICVVTGEGLWRWRIHTYSKAGSHEPFDDLIWRMVQYLSVSEDKSLFRIYTKNIVYENEPLIFEAELYNQAFELVNEPSVNLTIFNQDGLEYNFEMAHTGNSYRQNAGMFVPGDYTYKGQIQFGGEIYQVQGRFSVLALNLEGLQTSANHNLIFQVAQNTGGELYFKDQWDQLSEALLQRDDIKPVLYAQKDFRELVDYKLILILLILFLAVEWFVRKWNGGY